MLVFGLSWKDQKKFLFSDDPRPPPTPPWVNNLAIFGVFLTTDSFLNIVDL